MVVAAGATDGEPQDRPRDGINLLVHVVHHEADLEALVDVFHPQGEESGRDLHPVAFLVVARGQQVARDLLPDEAVVRHVGVDGINDIVTVLPGVGVRDVPARTGALAVAGHVEPVTTPAFAERRRGQQSVHDLRKRLGGIVRKKGIHIGGSRRQTGQVERDPANQRRTVGVGDRLQVLRLQAGQQEPVDIIPGPGGIAHLGCLGLRERLPGPVLFLECFVLRLRLAQRRRHLDGRPDGAVGDPFRQRGHLLVGQVLALGRHALLGLADDAFHQQAVSRLAGDDTRAGVATDQQAVAIIHTETAGGLGVGRVTRMAMIHEDRPYFLFEVLDLCRVGVGAERPRAQAERHKRPGGNSKKDHVFISFDRLFVLIKRFDTAPARRFSQRRRAGMVHTPPALTVTLSPSPRKPVRCQTESSQAGVTSPARSMSRLRQREHSLSNRRS